MACASAFLVAVLGGTGCASESNCAQTLTCPPVDAALEGEAHEVADASEEGSEGSASSAPSMEDEFELPSLDVGPSGGQDDGDGGGDGPGKPGEGDAGDSAEPRLVVDSGVANGVDCADGGACGAVAPVCDAGTCVACGGSFDCSGDAATCGALNACVGEAPQCTGTGGMQQCVACESGADCTAERPLCRAGECVGCTDAADCAAFPSVPLCGADGQCVACTGNQDCPNERAHCNQAGECVGCTQTDDCTGRVGASWCNSLSLECVECSQHQHCPLPQSSACREGRCIGCQVPVDCFHLPDTPVCYVEAAQCVECMIDEDCASIGASACVDYACAPCTEDAQCAHLPGTTVCDVSAGECVECTGTKDGACLGGPVQYVCDSLTRTCADPVPENMAGSLGSCGACLSDAHCGPGRVCVQTRFDGDPVPGWYCQWEPGTTGAPADCANEGRPYFGTTVGLTSIDGRQGLTVCRLSLSTCEALVDYSAVICDPDGDVVNQCGVPGMDDALCRAASPTNNLCTMRCLADADCPGGSSCSVLEEPRYCEF